jgi:hypothetical protein
MFTNPLADAIKRAVGARKPLPNSDPFIAVSANVLISTEEYCRQKNHSRWRAVSVRCVHGLPSYERDIQMKDEDTQPMPVKPGDVRCTFVLTIRGHGDKLIEPVFMDCMERYVTAVRSGFLRCGSVAKYTFDFASREVFVSVESIK